MNDLMKTPKMTPRIQSTLKHTVEVPEVMYKASGINVNGRRIKSYYLVQMSLSLRIITQMRSFLSILLHLQSRLLMRLSESLDNLSL